MVVLGKEFLIMDYGTVSQMIMQLGAPLAFCILLAWYVKYKDDKNREDMKEIVNAHKVESEKFAEALNKNTIVLERLATKLGDKDE